jgi:hypothetical protein
MFHQEKTIDGILCYRTNPNGDWRPYSQKELSLILKDRLFEKESEILELKRRISELNMIFKRKRE